MKCSLKWLIEGHTHLFLHFILGAEDTQDTSFTFQEGFQSSNDITGMKDKFFAGQVESLRSFVDKIPPPKI